MNKLTEKQTREQLIDESLKRTGWKKEYVKEEVNSIKSNFKTKK
jgi:type I restriction enzyme, R subunit